MKKYQQLDAGSMYPKIFISFCLSPENYVAHKDMPSYFDCEEQICADIYKGYEHWSKLPWGKYCVENNIIPIPVQYRQSIEELKKIKDYKDCNFEGVTELRGIYYFKQNSEAILVKAFEEPMRWKSELKEKLKHTLESDPNKEIYKQEYDSSKRFNNTGFGGSGSIYSILFKLEVFNADTFLARDLMLYIKDQIEKAGFEMIFIDTDSFVVYAEDNISKLLNAWAMDWAIDRYGNRKFNLRFENEGYYKSLYVGGNCRYMGYLIKENGDIEEKVRGLQVKRKSSTEFQKKEQKVFLKWLLEGHTIDEIKVYIDEWVSRLLKTDIIDLAIPCRFSKPREKYGKNEEFFTAYDNTQKLHPDFIKDVEAQFLYIQVEGETELLAFDENHLHYLKNYKLDYKTIIEKQILNLLIPTFAGINLGKELLEIAEKYGIQLESAHRNTLLEEYENYEELKKYYSSNEAKKRRPGYVTKVEKPKKVKNIDNDLIKELSNRGLI